MQLVIANDQTITNGDKREIENKLKEYVTGIKPDFITNVSNSVNDLVLLQQDYIQYIRKANLVLSKTDGIMNSNNEPDVYDISGDTFTQLVDYLEKIIKSISKKIPISLDTRKSEIMKKGIKFGVVGNKRKVLWNIKNNELKHANEIMDKLTAKPSEISQSNNTINNLNFLKV